jgi:hypothetical protein
MIHKTISLSDADGEKLKQLPRSFNFSEFVRDQLQTVFQTYLKEQPGSC